VRDPSLIGPEIGIPVYEGEVYGFEFVGVDEDVLDDDPLGRLRGIMTVENGWAVGTWSERGSVVCDEPAEFPYIGDFCIETQTDNPYVRPGDKPAHFSVTYEIRRTPLPDLRPTAIRVVNTPGNAADQVCISVDNAGDRPAPNFTLVLDVFGNGPIPVRTIRDAVGLDPARFREECFDVTLPASGQHPIVATVDPDRVIAEGDDRNNRLEQLFVGVGVAGDQGVPPSAGAGATRFDPGAAVPGGPKPDLTVGAIRVQGKHSSGRNDCDSGVNDVTVVIKNQGHGAATSFLVRVVDTQATGANEQTVPTLGGDQELTLEFEDVRLSKGEHTLTARVDAKQTVDESSEENNESQATVNCKDEGG
jgi:hypothetical protein